MEMAQLALQADLPSEGKQVVDKGFAQRRARHRRRRPSAHKRLRDLVDKKLAEDTAARAEDERQAAGGEDAATRWSRSA